ncbi:MAG: hypothetical protein NTX72_01115 [Candidatus Uhrbacteria bacterium]|nr:hypothetical protein [Candidatus Uhrbacteria bacterium]
MSQLHLVDVFNSCPALCEERSDRLVHHHQNNESNDLRGDQDELGELRDLLRGYPSLYDQDILGEQQTGNTDLEPEQHTTQPYTWCSGKTMRCASDDHSDQQDQT